MGASLPRPVESVLVERHVGYGFRAAVAEMNGWRTNMEDAHVVHIREDWAFFGIFDGHGGDACSTFVAKRLPELLAAEGCPPDDAAVRALALRVDEEFLQSSSPTGGSTGTMCIVHKPKEGGKHRLRVANVGDSRVLLGKRPNGQIVPGGGTDFGLTTDHKPNLPSERQRIERCGGTVVMAEGNVPRVNGDLAVSRAFGDAGHKRTGGPAPEDRPVTADPELGDFECGEEDFVLLVCDGVSEGRFSNTQVVQLAAQVLRETGDPGQAARAVIMRALERGSRDNISCMMVLLNGSGVEQTTEAEFLPGPVNGLGHPGFRSAYESVAQRAGLTLIDAVDQRFCAVRALEAKLLAARRSRPEPLRDESVLFDDGPTDDIDRTMWFRRWLRDLPTDDFGPSWTPAASAASSPYGDGLGNGPVAQETESMGVALALVVTVLGGVLSRQLGSRFGASPTVQGVVIVATLVVACLAWGISSRILRRSRQKAKDL